MQDIIPINKERKKTHLKYSLMILSFIMILCALAVYLDKLAIDDQEEIFNSQQRLQTETVSLALGDKLSRIIKSAQYLSENFFPKKLRLQQKQDILKLKKTLKAEASVIKEIAYIGFHPSPDRILASQGYDNNIGMNARMRALQWTKEYWQQLQALDQGYIAPPVSSTESYRFLGALIPVRDSEGIVGITSVVIDLDPIVGHFLTPLRFGEYGSAYLIDGSGFVVFDEEETIIGQSVINLHKNYDQLLRIDRRMLTTITGTGEYSFTVRGSRHTARKLVAWSSVGIDRAKLTVALSAPESDATRAMFSILSFRMILSLFIAFCAIVLVYYFHQRNRKERLMEQNRRLNFRDQVFDAMVSNIPGIIYKGRMDSDLTMTYMSSRTESILGYPASEFIHNRVRSFSSHIHPEDRQYVYEKIYDSYEKNTNFSLEYRLRDNAGRYHWVLENGRRIPGEDFIVGAIFDNTERKINENQLAIAEQKYSQFFQNAPVGIFQSTPDGRFISANPQLAELYGYPSTKKMIASVKNITEDCYKVPEERERLMNELRANGKVSNFESLQRRKDGSTFWGSETMLAVFDENDKLIRFDGFISDISKRKESEEAMRHLAMYDQLTGLPNRLLYNDRLTQALSQAERNDSRVALLYADLDNFKTVNDELGHIAGDSVLTEVASRFSGCLRSSDTVARLGGDEFAFILQDIRCDDEIANVASRVIQCMEAPFPIADRSYRIGVSIGVSIFPDDTTDREDLLKYSDRAMYKAKRGGKNTCRFCISKEITQ